MLHRYARFADSGQGNRSIFLCECPSPAYTVSPYRNDPLLILTPSIHMSPHQSQPAAQPRPVFLELWRIRLPLPGMVSILHRLSGVFMVLAIPIGAWALGSAVASASGYERITGLLSAPLVKIALLVLLWSFLHHLFAGLRYLVMDLGLAVDLKPARLTAAIALGAGLVITLILGGVLL
ncbi:succinate dehydrogenase, cytochrome b556 subunit [Thiorhodovibrio frisius]|uniref:Succinate dehydrogenase cytochrome b556 subunit n=2 Tax=Thiorhodovibrio frisius TaxID=631362 RepID=H8YWM5_9GAMM|nr:succinate dehydrogenase, cytochrome b556 subunit [Thiorhodovibrio frisius]WPL22892.1 Succinate dehydrogenase cytochrome b556 subunit [Thiorhodovibrio frisius]